MGVELIVSVTLTNLPRTIQRTDLRKVAFLTNGASTAFTGRSKIFTSASDVSADFGASDDMTLAATAFFAQTPQLKELTILREDAADANITATFNAVKDEDFFTLLTPGRYEVADIADQDTISTLIEAEDKMYGALTNDPNAKSAANETNIGHLVQVANRENTYVLYHKDALTNFFEAALISKGLGQGGFGDSDFNALNLANVVGEDKTTISDQERADLTSNNVTYYAIQGGLGTSIGGDTGSGLAIDTIGLRQDIAISTAEDLAQMVINSAKIGYDQRGLDRVDASIVGSVGVFEGRGVIIPTSTVITVPKFEDVLDADKAARVLNNVNINVQEVGSIRTINITLNLQL